MKVSVSTPIKRSGRVQQVESMFDIPMEERADLEWELPPALTSLAGRVEAVEELEEKPWHIGMIVGPSGSGKTTIARELWPESYVDANRLSWPEDVAMVDGIEAPVRDVVKTLTAVGFGSPPNWLRPYAVLSTGEQFRANVARALLEIDRPVIDEFTSVVDRTVAQVGSSAVAKTVRRAERRMVAVSCHYDIIDWLQPDWVYRADTGQLEWRHLQRRPALDLEIRWVAREAWEVFRRYHYLSGHLHAAARCMGAFLDGECIAFQACYPRPHPHVRNIMAGHRTVVLPDYQGLGIGVKLKDFMAQYVHDYGGWRYRTTLAHPALASSHARSPRWREVKGQNKPSRSRKPKRLVKQHAATRKLSTRTFEYVPI